MAQFYNIQKISREKFKSDKSFFVRFGIDLYNLTSLRATCAELLPEHVVAEHCRSIEGQSKYAVLPDRALK